MPSSRPNEVSLPPSGSASGGKGGRGNKKQAPAEQKLLNRFKNLKDQNASLKRKLGNKGGGKGGYGRLHRHVGDMLVAVGELRRKLVAKVNAKS